MTVSSSIRPSSSRCGKSQPWSSRPPTRAVNTSAWSRLSGAPISRSYRKSSKTRITARRIAAVIAFPGYAGTRPGW
ncbi:MAG: hypothetical protein JF621_17295 [Streptomyces turgidiscabies]|nr:hypothetical protein [Streptomyces turgidiscabies]